MYWVLARTEAAIGGVLLKKMFLKISQNSREKTCKSLFFNKVAGLRPATLLRMRLWHRCFPVNFAKFLRTPFLQNTSGRLLLPVKLCIVIECRKFQTKLFTLMIPTVFYGDVESDVMEKQTLDLFDKKLFL